MNHENECLHSRGGKTPLTWSTTMLLLSDSNPRVWSEKNILNHKIRDQSAFLKGTWFTIFNSQFVIPYFWFAIWNWPIFFLKDSSVLPLLFPSLIINEDNNIFQGQEDALVPPTNYLLIYWQHHQGGEEEC